MEKALDRRTRYTRRVIKEALFELMEKKQKVTVKVLCALADINRSTFYTHYETITDLLAEVELEKGKELMEVISTLWMGEDYFRRVLDGILDYFEKDPVMCDLLLGPHSTGKGMEQVLRRSQEQSVDHWTANGVIDREQAQWVYVFLEYGVKELLYRWYLDGFRADRKKLRDAIIGITELGLSGFVYQTAI